MRCLVEELGASDLAGADQPITIALNKSLVLDAPITVPAGANVRLTGASDLDTGGRRRLQGLASDGTSISGGLSSRLFAVSDGSTLEIKDVALLGGFHTESGGAILVEGGSLYLTSCLVQGSYSEANGGAVHVAATAASAVVKVMDSMFDANSAEGDGGALSIEKDGTGAAEVAISGTIFQDNTATERGGALRAESYSATDTIIVAINGGLFQGNEANGGGAAYFQKATLHLGGSELRDNSALGGMEAHGGALNLLQSTLDATNVTAVGNSAEERGGCIFMDSASFVDLSDSVLERNTAGTFGGAICNYGGSTLDVYTSKLLFNNATDGSEVYNDNSDFYARESWFEDSVAQVGDYVLHAEKGALVLDTCTVRSADELAVASDFAATLRNTDVFGDVFLTGGAGRLAACADLSDPWNDLSCSEQYCSDAPAGGYGIRCYCDTVHGPQDPMTGSCEDPPQIYVLQDVFDLYALKPASVETDVFFVNQGDKPLFWKVELADWPGPHEWAFSPQTGNLSTCETGNFSIRLDAFNVTAYQDYEIRLNIVSSSYPFSISEDYSVYSPVNTSVNVGVQYYFEAVANASLSHLAPVGKTLAATAGEYLEVLVKPVDNDGLWIRGSGSDHFRASLHRSGDGAGGRDGTVCAVGYESGLDMHQIMCLLDPFQAGLFELSVTVGQDAVPVGDSPYEVAVGCGDEFTEVNGTCGCAPGHRLEVETVQCIACAKGKYGASYATVDAPNPCRKCVEFVQLSTTATDGASSLAQCICSPGYFYLEAEENCVPCLEGGACPDYGHTLRSIVIQSEYWRSSDNSSVTLYCENHPSLCIGDMVAGDGEAGIGDDVDDRGDCDDPETGRLCRCHHKGPYCEVCTGEGERYKSLEGSCIECKEVNRGNVIGAIIALVLILVLGTAGAIYGAWLQVKDFEVKERELKKAYHKPGAGDGAPANVVSKDNDISEEERDAVVIDDYQGRMVGEASVMATLAMAAAQNLPGVGGSGGGGAGAGGEGVATVAGGGGSGGGSGGGGLDGFGAFEDLTQQLKGMLKQVFGELQLLTCAVQSGANLPSSYSVVLGVLALARMDVCAVFPLECIFDEFDYHSKLVVNTVWPIFFGVWLVSLYGLGYFAFPKAKLCREAILQLLFMFFFFVYTGVTNILFGLYECETFVDERKRYLKKDYSIDCDSDAHKRSELFGCLMIFVYPIGIPLAYLAVLYMHRYKLSCAAYKDMPGGEELSLDALYKIRDKDPELAHLHFLFYEYRGGFWFMEVLQCSRKMAMVAVITFIVPGSSTSVALSMFAVLLLLGIYAYSKPCLSKHDDTMLTISQGSTFVVLLTVLMAKNSEGMPEVVVTLLLYLSTLVPVAACFYILGSEYSRYRKNTELSKALEALEKNMGAMAEGDDGGSRSRDWDERRGAIPATAPA